MLNSPHSLEARLRTRRARVRWTAVAFGLVLGVGSCASGPAPTLVYASGTEAPDLSGVWQVTRYVSGVRTIDGDVPPLLPDARAEYERNLVERQDLPPEDDLTRCVPPGAPRINFAPFPLLIAQTERKLTFLYEYRRGVRHIYMDEELPPRDELDFSFMGESAARWDGDTLVIETAGFNDVTVLDREGLPHGENMRLTERLRLLDGGRRLESVMTIDDADTFSAPWTTRLVLERKPDVELQEYDCIDRYEEY